MDLQSAVKGYTSFIQRWPKSVIFAVLIITALFFIPLSKIRIDSSPALFTPEFIQAPYDRIASRIDIPVAFHEVYIIGKDNESVLSLESMKEQARLVSFLRDKFDVETVGAVDVLNKELHQRYNQSIENVAGDEALGEIIYRIYSGSPSDFRVMAHAMMGDDLDLSALDKRYFIETILPFFSYLPMGNRELPNIGFTAIDIHPKNRNLTEDEKKELSVAIRTAVDSQNFSHIQVMHYSLYLVGKDVDDKIGGSTLLLGSLTLIAMVSLIYFGFRKAYYVFIPLFVTGVALVWAFGSAELLHLNINVLHTFVIAMIVTLSIEGPVHMIKRYLEERKGKEPEPAMEFAMSSIFIAMFLVSFTTIVSFLVSYILPSSPALNSFEAVVLIGISYAFILEIILVPALMAMKEYPSSLHDSSALVKKVFGWLFDRFSELFWVLSAIVIMVFLLAIYNLGNIRTDVSAGMFVPDGIPSKEALKVSDQFATEYQPQYVLIEGNVTQPQVLVALDILEDAVKDNEDYEKVNGEVRFESVNTLMRSINLSHGSDLDKTFEVLKEDGSIIDPVNRLTVADKVNIYILKNGTEFDTILALIWVKSARSEDIRIAYDELRADLVSSGLQDIPGITIELSGKAFRATQTEVYVRQMQIFSSILMFVFTFILIFSTYRKLILSVIISLPIFVVSFITLGLMPVLDMPLTWLNATVVALLIGLGVDYGIYLAERYKEELKKGKDSRDAARIALIHTGDGIWLASFTTISGFIIVSFSFLPMARSFGILTAISLFLVFLITILLMPQLLMRFVKK